MTTICYRLDEPVIYNEGTPYEKKCDTFLHCYLYSSTIAEAQNFCDKLNSGEIVNSDYPTEGRTYYAHEQEEMGN